LVGSGNGSAEEVDSVVGSGVGLAELVDLVVGSGSGTGVITIAGLVVELEVDLLKTVDVVVVGAAVTIVVFFEDDEEGDAVLGVSFGGAEDAALLVVET
jgi:hypothetical protein